MTNTDEELINDEKVLARTGLQIISHLLKEAEKTDDLFAKRDIMTKLIPYLLPDANTRSKNANSKQNNAKLANQETSQVKKITSIYEPYANIANKAK